MERLRGKRSIVTGAGSGIGRAIALRLAAEGANVLVSDVDETAARAVARELGGETLVRKTDVTKSEEVEALVATVVVVVILRLSRRLRSGPWALALGCLLGGAVGNLIDRVVREPAPLRGHVVDFLELPNWPVFNLADSAIVGAAVLVALLTVRGVALDGSNGVKHGDPRDGSSPEAGPEQESR